MPGAAPHLPTMLILIGAVTLYPAAPATAELEGRAPSMLARFADVPALHQEVRISLGAAAMPLADLARPAAEPWTRRLTYGGAPRVPAAPEPLAPWQSRLNPRLTLRFTSDSPATQTDRTRPGFASAIAASAARPLVPSYQMGAFVAWANISAIDFGQAVRGHVRPGDEVPQLETPFLQLALDF